jgi:hypothetical protein
MSNVQNQKAAVSLPIYIPIYLTVFLPKLNSSYLYVLPQISLQKSIDRDEIQTVK